MILHLNEIAVTVLQLGVQIYWYKNLIISSNHVNYFLDRKTSKERILSKHLHRVNTFQFCFHAQD